MRILNTIKSQILHRIRFQKYNHEKRDDNYQEAQWQVDRVIVFPQVDLYTLSMEAEFGGHFFDITIIYTDPKANGFDESHTQGPNTALVPRSYLEDSSVGQNREVCPFSDPSASNPSNLKSHGQSQDVKTVTNLRHTDGSEQISESILDIEAANEPMHQPSWRQNDNPSTIEINDSTTQIIPENKLNHSTGGKHKDIHSILNENVYLRKRISRLL